MPWFTFVADGSEGAVEAESRQVLAALPMEFYARRGAYRYQAVLINVPASPFTGLSLPLAWEDTGTGGPAPDVPFTLRPFLADAAAHPSRGLVEGVPVPGTEALAFPGASIPVVQAGTLGDRLVPATSIGSLNIAVTPGFYWLVLDLGAHPFVVSRTLGWTLSGFGPGDGTAFALLPEEHTAPFNTAPVSTGTAGAAWDLDGSVRGLPVRVNGASPVTVRGSLDGGLTVSAAEDLASFGDGDWPVRMQRPYDLWDTALGGTQARGERTVTLRAARTYAVGASSYTEERTETASILYRGGPPVVRGLHIHFRTSG